MSNKRKRRRTFMLRVPQLESLEARALLTAVPWVGEFDGAAFVDGAAVVDGAENPGGGQHAEAALILTANNLTISTGETVTLTTANLNAVNTANPEAELIFLISDVNGGYFEFIDEPGVPEDVFDLIDIQEGFVRFVHDGSNTAPSYWVQVEDGDTGAITDPEQATVIFNGGPPNADFNSDGNLNGADIDALVANIALGPADPSTFDLTSDGQVDLADRDEWLRVAGAANLPSGSPYSIADANLDGNVDGQDFITWNDNKFTNVAAWTAGDFNADGGVDGQDFILWNDNKFTTASPNQAPTLTANNLTISEGEAVTINGSNLAANDPDGPNSSLSFGISSVMHGQFERTNNPGTAVTSFTQAEVTSGSIRFVHDGSTMAPAYMVSVSDGVDTTSPAAATVTFFPSTNAQTPSLVANSLAIVRGSTVVLSSSQLDAIDPDSPNASLMYTASGVSNGRFERMNNPGTAITSFSKAEVDARQIQFVHDNTHNAPTYSVSVSDGTNASATLPASIAFSMGHMHPPGPTFQAALDLVTDNQATHRAVASGNWSDPTVWENGQLPTTGARIVIPTGISVTVDSEISTRFETLRIDGALRFATNANTRLRVDTMVSTHDALLEIGTSTIPIQPQFTANIQFIDDGGIDRNVDPTMIGRGAILHGRTTIYGAETTGRMALATHPTAGATQLELSSIPTGWEVGDQLIITSTDGPTNDEIRTISGITGTTVTLNQALNLDHVAPLTDLDVYVANTTRNVQFSSENDAVLRRGHIMFMHTLNVDANYVSFTDLGRTDKSTELDDLLFEFPEVPGNETSAGIVFDVVQLGGRNIRGRYPVHFHRGGIDPNSTPARMHGSVVMTSPGWGFVNHSGNVDMTNNVAYGAQGAAFYTEAGNEIGSIVGNLAIRTVSPNASSDPNRTLDVDLQAENQSFGVDGDGFWLSGNMVSLRDNVSAGATGHGIIIWADGLVEADTGRATVPVANIPNGHLITDRTEVATWWAPLAEIENNVSYSALIGFRSRYVHSSIYLGERGSLFHTAPDQAYVDTLAPVVDGLTVWGSRDGVLLNYNERMSLKNARLVGTGAQWVQNGGTTDTGMGIDMYNDVSFGPGVVENVSIEGFSMGILAPRHDDWQIRNLDLRNTTDMLIVESRLAPRTMQMENITFGSLAGTAVANTAGQRRNIAMEANLEADSGQPYFFLMPDQITLDGQGLYFDQQAANHVLLTDFDPNDLLVPISNEFLNRTNQSLFDQYSTSFGGVITPASATTSGMITGGRIGPVSPPNNITPPMYSMIGEIPILIDPGTLTNFTLPSPTAQSPQAAGEIAGERSTTKLPEQRPVLAEPSSVATSFSNFRNETRPIRSIADQLARTADDDDDRNTQLIDHVFAQH